MRNSVYMPEPLSSPVLEVFADESCQTQHRYLVLGGLACERKDTAEIEQLLTAVRVEHRTFGEVKWTKVSRAKLSFYKDFVDVVFDAMRTSRIHFHSLIADTSEFDHKKYNRGSKEIGFHKLIYQLLVQKFGRLYADNYRLYVYLDGRTTRASLIELRAMLNAGLANQWDIRGYPYRRVDFRDSKSSDLFQVNDLLLGAIGHRTNQHHLVKGSSVAKIEMVAHVTRRAAISDLAVGTPRTRQNFTVWNFHYGR